MAFGLVDFIESFTQQVRMVQAYLTPSERLCIGVSAWLGCRVSY